MVHMKERDTPCSTGTSTYTTVRPNMPTGSAAESAALRKRETAAATLSQEKMTTER